MGYPGNPVVTGSISVSDSSDTYATHIAELGKGSHRTVNTITLRNAIPTDRREFGMLVTVIADSTPANNKTYQLANVALGGTNNTITDNANWIQFASGSAWGTITGTISSQTDLQNELDSKVSVSGDEITGYLTFSNELGIDNTNLGDTLYIGDQKSALISIGNFSSNTDIIGGLTIHDSLITLNKGGGVSSESGIEVEEGGSVVAYLKTLANGKSWVFKVNNTIYTGTFQLVGMTASRTWDVPNSDGTLALITDINATNFTGILSSINGGTGINNSGRTLTINTNSGTLSFSSASSTLTIPATGTVALGTGTANRIAYWSGTNTVAATGAITQNQILFADSSGLPKGDASLTWVFNGGTSYSMVMVGDNYIINQANTANKAYIRFNAGVGIIFDGTASQILRFDSSIQFSTDSIGIKNADGDLSIQFTNTTRYTSFVNPVAFTHSIEMDATDPYLVSIGDMKFIMDADNTSSSNKFYWYTNNISTQVAALDENGMAIGSHTATARLHLAAGTATANTAPLKLNTGTLTTTAEAGAIEYVAPFLYATPTGTDRRPINVSGLSTQSGASYTITTSDFGKVVHLTNTAARTITLPAANTIPAGYICWIKDAAGTATTANITINRAGSDTIEGLTSYVLNANYDSIGFYSDGSSIWYFIY